MPAPETKKPRRARLINRPDTRPAASTCQAARHPASAGSSRSSSLSLALRRCRRALVGAMAAQDVEHREIALVARVLEHPVAVVAVERQLERPRCGPRLRILDGEAEHEPVVRNTRVALGDLELLAVACAADVH